MWDNSCAWLAQVLSVVTIGNDQDGLTLETALGMETSTFICHFTCPSFAINEVPCLFCAEYPSKGCWKRVDYCLLRGTGKILLLLCPMSVSLCLL